jgi:hypothetical protein
VVGYSGTERDAEEPRERERERERERAARTDARIVDFQSGFGAFFNSSGITPRTCMHARTHARTHATHKRRICIRGA